MLTLNIRHYDEPVSFRHSRYTRYSIFYLNYSEEYKQSETLFDSVQYEKVLNPDLADFIGSLSQLSYGPISKVVRTTPGRRVLTYKISNLRILIFSAIVNDEFSGNLAFLLLCCRVSPPGSLAIYNQVSGEDTKHHSPITF